ncbi:MAG: nucleotide sugar dehydrogenase [Bacteroidales bacterium]|jgi:GDP-mannose 6-dehydrogenase|nr:nucleotide sugar dehydrogenase [Bacteroidales bacterium]
MNISVFGLGYVGCVSLGCLAQNGHNVIGVDISVEKVDLINQGKPTIIEGEIDEIISKQYKLKKISATSDYKKAVSETDISILCVGTPSTREGHLNQEQIYTCARQIGECLKSKETFHIIVIRSTVFPGTNKKVGEIIENVSKKKRNIDFAIVSNPEFLREGTAVNDYYNPSITVLGSDNEYALSVMNEVHKEINAPAIEVEINVAEIIKYINNSFHALKICFANEVGNICKRLEIDSHDVMNLFSKDNKLNISSYYLRPGFAYGGSCLPKDLKALNTLAHDYYLESPVLSAIERSNDYHKELALKTILDTGKNTIGFVGISFKEGTDDLRFSPSVEIIEKLIGKGKKIYVYDPNVQISKLIGSNKSYIEEKLPHISSLLIKDLDKMILESEVIVFPNKMSELNYLQINKEKIIIDFFRNESLMGYDNYIGLCW